MQVETPSLLPGFDERFRREISTRTCLRLLCGFSFLRTNRGEPEAAETISFLADFANSGFAPRKQFSVGVSS